MKQDMIVKHGRIFDIFIMPDNRAYFKDGLNNKYESTFYQTRADCEVAIGKYCVEFMIGANSQQNGQV
jgi:hypothetical protein